MAPHRAIPLAPVVAAMMMEVRAMPAVMAAHMVRTMPAMMTTHMVVAIAVTMMVAILPAINGL